MRNSGPEKLVEKEILAFGKQVGFDLTVVDTAAVYNPMAGRYLRKQASESLPDIIGNYGPLSVWIELKAKGQRSAINAKKNAHQKAFLIRKIKQGSFAIVTDSAEHFNQIWNRYRMASNFDKMHLLLNDLPQPRGIKARNHQQTFGPRP